MDLDEQIRNAQWELDALLFRKHGLGNKLSNLLEALKPLKLVGWESQGIFKGSTGGFYIKLSIYFLGNIENSRSVLLQNLSFNTSEEAEIFLRVFEHEIFVFAPKVKSENL
jgi:hypothetical protein